MPWSPKTTLSQQHKSKTTPTTTTTTTTTNKQTKEVFAYFIYMYLNAMPLMSVKKLMKGTFQVLCVEQVNLTGVCTLMSLNWRFACVRWACISFN